MQFSHFMIWWTITMVIAVGHMAIHELGHIFAALAVGSRVKGIGWGRLGPYTVREAVANPFMNALVALSGPAANLLTWYLLIGLGYDGHNPRVYCALFLALFNLLPLPCSDMTRVLCCASEDYPKCSGISSK